MKKSTLMLLMLAVVSVYSCKKDNSTTTTTNNNTTTSQSMTAKIDGKDWSAHIMGGSYINGSTSISGQAQDGQTITISLFSKHGKGTYALTASSSDAAAYSVDNTGSSVSYTSNATDSAGKGGGSITITEFDTVNHVMSGTFSFEVVRGTDMAKKNITSGTFTKLAYSTSQATTTSTMKASINGTAWTAGSVFAMNNSGQLTITGSSGNYTKTIGMYMPSNITAGTYQLEGMGGTYYAQYNDGNNYMASSSGTLTITANANHTIAGTFSFQASDLYGTTNVTVTNGSFKANY